MVTVTSSLAAWAGELPEGAPESDTQELLGLLDASSSKILEYLGQYGTLIVNSLPNFRNWFSAFAGINLGMRASVDDLLSQLVSQLNSYCPLNAISIANLNREIERLNMLAASPQPPMTSELAAQCTTLAGHIKAIRPFMQAVEVPSWTIYGTTAKVSGEPLAADGDYNGDGFTNLQAYNLVTAAHGDRFDFVRAAASDNPFWPGNPTLPVTGPAGLAAMTVLCGILGVL